MSVTDFTEDSRRPIVDWAAILGGAVLTTAIALILLTFGAALGLSVASPYDGEGLKPAWFAIAAGLWLLWVQLLSFSIGGYVTARLRPRSVGATDHEVDVRDGLHGLLMWGTGVLAAAVISFASIGGVTSAARTAESPRDLAASVASVAGEAMDDAAATEVAKAEAPSDASLVERRAEVARKLTILAAFITAASLFIGAVAAFVTAGIGGRHRDQNTMVKFFVLRD